MHAMEHSSAEMTCVLKLNSKCEKCKVKMMKILQNLSGAYSITIDGEQGTVKVTGRANPSSLLEVLEKYGKHGELKYVRVDGETKERRQCYYYYREHEYAPYGMINSTYSPPLGCPQRQWCEANLRFFPPPALPPPLPPLGPPPLVAPFQVAPPFPLPLAPFWALPPPPPPPCSDFFRGCTFGENGKSEKAHGHCTIM